MRGVLLSFNLEGGSMAQVKNVVEIKCDSLLEFELSVAALVEKGSIERAKNGYLKNVSKLTITINQEGYDDIINKLSQPA
jgi:hypothetical protein